jgi:hypothetical protein
MGQLKQWRDQNWKRIDSQGNIAGECGTIKDKKNPDRCLPASKANSLTKKQRASTANKKKRESATVVANTKAAKVSVNSGGEIRKQNRVKMKNGGFIAKGCGKVMDNRRKVTTIS